MDNRWIVPHSPVLSRHFQTHINMESYSISINQSITVFFPRLGLSLQTEPSLLYPLLSLPFRIFISIYHKVVYHLISSAANFLPFTNPSRASFSRQFLLSQWPSQFIFLFFLISSSIIIPSPTISSTTAFVFCLSILYAPYFSISTSEMLPVVFAHSVVVSKSLHHMTLHSTQSTSLPYFSFPRACRKCFFSC